MSGFHIKNFIIIQEYLMPEDLVIIRSLKPLHIDEKRGYKFRS